MNLTIADVANLARVELQDAAKDYWTDQELLDYVNEARDVLYMAVPRIYEITETFTLVEGSRQTLPNSSKRLFNLLEIAMLYTLVVVLLVLWLAGLVTSFTAGGLLHILLPLQIPGHVFRNIMIKTKHMHLPTIGCQHTHGARTADCIIIMRNDN